MYILMVGTFYIFNCNARFKVLVIGGEMWMGSDTTSDTASNKYSITVLIIYIYIYIYIF